MQRHFGFLKTTLLGGLLFLLPLAVVGALLGQVVPIVTKVAETLIGHMPFRTPIGVAALIVLTIVLLILLCFLAGLIARLSFGRRWSHWIEKQLLMLFPRYAILRNLLAEKVGSENAVVQLQPVLVRIGDQTRLAFETDRARGKVALYLPGSPDTWSGFLTFVDEQAVTPLAMELSKAVNLCERMGRESIDEIEGR